MTTRLAAAITVALLFGGMLYFSLPGSSTLDAQTERVVCPTVTPTPTPTPEEGVPTPTSTPPPDGTTIPAFPMIFKGSVTVVGNPPFRDCELYLYAKVGDAVSGFRPIVAGKYDNLAIGAREQSAEGQPVTFHLSEDVMAAETFTYIYFPGPPDPPQRAFPTLDLTFPHLVTPSPTPLPEDTPTPTGSAVGSPSPAVATVPPPTMPPTSTPTPLTAQPAIYSGPLTIAGLAAIPPGSVLTARIGSYESQPAAIVGQGYQSLVIAPGSSSFIGQPIEFFLNGFKSVSLDTFESGARKTDLEIIFIGYPTPTPTPETPPTPEPTPVPTPEPPTNTPTPTQTPVPEPTNTPEPAPPPTATASPPPTPTATLRPTRTPIPTLPPTRAPEVPVAPPTATIIEVVVTATPGSTDTPTPESEGGFCSFAGPTPLSAGLGSLLMLFAPVGLLYGARQVRRNRRS